MDSIVSTVAPRKLSAPTLKPLNQFVVPAKGKGSGCLFCPILPTVRGVKIGDDYKGGGKDHDKNVNVHRMLGRGTDKPKILIVLDNPSEKEDAENDPASGRDAQRIIDSMENAGIEWRKLVRFTYAVKCHGQGATCVGTTALKVCNAYLARDIANTNPEIIVPIGATALKAIAGPSYRVDACHGSPFKLLLAGKERTVFPVFSPGTLYYKDTLQPVWDAAWVSLKKLVSGAVSVGEGLGTYRQVKSAKEAAAMFDSYKDQDVAFDYETNSLDPMDTQRPVPTVEKRPDGTFKVTFACDDDDFDPKTAYEKATVAMVSWAVKAGEGFYVLRDHVDGKWTDDDRMIFDAAFRRFLKRRSVRKLVFNGMFEDTWSRVFFGQRMVNFYDVMMFKHQSFEEPPHSLDATASQHTAMGNWKQPIKAIADAFRHNYRHIPVKIIGPYAGADADATYRLKSLLLKTLDESRSRIARIFYPLLISALAGMQAIGTHADRKYAEFFEKFTRLHASNAESDINRLAVVRKYCRHKKRTDPRAGKRDAWRFNLNSPDQIKEILYGELKYEPLKFTNSYDEDSVDFYDSFDEVNTAFGSSDKDSLAHFIREYECAFSKALIDWRLHSKQHSTYAVSLLDQLDRFDNFIRGQFKPAGTVTGRLSSSSPNLQNQPGMSRRLYISRFKGGVIVSLDYSQIEVRVAASLSGDKLLLKAYREGKDVHFLTMCRIFEYTDEEGKALEVEDPKLYKQQRTIAKRIVFGVLYGIGAPGIVNTLRKEEVIITDDQAQEYIDRFFGVYTGLRRYIDKVHDRMYDTGAAASPFGRLRHLADIHSSNPETVNRAKRQGPNAVIQGTASDMTLTSLILIDAALRKAGLRSRLIITVHDSILIDCPANEVEQVTRLSLDIMENLPKYAGKIWGRDFNWSWLKCPIVAEAEVGLNWRDGVAYTPGYVRKDEKDKRYGVVSEVIQKAAAVQEKEDRKYHDLYLFAKLHDVYHDKSLPKTQKFLSHVASVLRPGRTDGNPLESKDRKRLRKLSRRYSKSRR